MPLFIDNEGALKLSRNPELHNRTKHIDIKYHHLREKVEDGTVTTLRVDTKDNLADVLTKPLSNVLHEDAIRKLGMIEADPDDNSGKAKSGGELE